MSLPQSSRPKLVSRLWIAQSVETRRCSVVRTSSISVSFVHLSKMWSATSSIRLMSTINRRSNILTSTYPDVKFSERNFFEQVWSKSEVIADRVALVRLPVHLPITIYFKVDAVTEEAITYGQGKQQALNFGLNLRRTFGGSRKDSLAILAQNCLEYPLIMTGELWKTVCFCHYFSCRLRRCWDPCDHLQPFLHLT